MARTIHVYAGRPDIGTPAVGGPSADVGAVPIGSASYTIPSGSIFVATDGNDTTGVGTQAAPYRTVQKAVNSTTGAKTVVIRGGVYNEAWSCTKPDMTFQNYPGETVWFDGTNPLTGWATSGGNWAAPWVLITDHSPGTTSGAIEVTTHGWFYTDPLFPLAAWPEQVWLDGNRLDAVGTEAEVVPGTFFVRGAASGSNNMIWTSSHIVIGDDPTGHEIRVTTSARLTRACTVTAANCTFRGFGFRRWGTHISYSGAIYFNLNADGALFENMVFEHQSGFNLSISGCDNVVIQHCTMSNHGNMGIRGYQNWNLLVQDCRFFGNNRAMFCFAPESGDIKCTRTRGGLFQRNRHEAGNCSGLWLDELCYQVSAVSNDFRGCGHHGMVCELSRYITVTDNLFTGVADTAFRTDTDNSVNFWNNTVVGCSFGSNRSWMSQPQPAWIVQSARVYAGNSIRDSRINGGGDDPTMSWDLDPYQAGNNAWGISAFSGALVVVTDALNNGPYSLMGVNLVGGNLYNRVTGTDPTTAFVNHPYSTLETSLASWQSFSGQDIGSAQVTGSKLVFEDGSISYNGGAIPQALPAAVTAVLPASLASFPRVGAWR